MFAASFMIREKKIITQKIELQIESKTVIAYNKKRYLISYQLFFQYSGISI